MGVSAKLDADVGSFISNINNAKTQVKTLDAEIKKIDATFKATGNAEEQLANKTQALNNKLQQQKTIVSQYEKAMDQMAKSGVDPASESYQKMAQQMLTAQAAMMQTQAELNSLDGSQQKAATSADKLGKSVGEIGKKLSLDQVITGINKITGAMEAAAQKAIQFGEQLFNSIMESAQWADDTESMALMYGIDLDTMQRMQKLVTNGLDTTVDAIIKSQQKLNLNVGKGSKEALDTLRDLGLIVSSGKGQEVLVTDDSVDLFWEAGRAIMNMGKGFDQEAAAMALFGKSWHELIPLFTEFETRADYEKALSEVNVVSEESVENLATLADRIGELEGNFSSLKNEVFGALAPALTEAAEALSGLLSSVLEYLKTPEGKKALEDMGTAVSGLFSSLGEIDPEKVVEGFSTVFNKIVEGIQWIVDNKETAIAALKTIVTAWGALEIGGSILTILKLIDGINSLGGGSGTGGTGGGAPTAGTGGNGGGDHNFLYGLGAKAKALAGKAGTWLTGAMPTILDIAGGLGTQVGVIGAAILPAVLAQKENEEKWISEQNDRIQLADTIAEAVGESAETAFIRAAAEATGPKKDENGNYKRNLLGSLDMGMTDSTYDLLMGLKYRQNEQKAALATAIHQYAPVTEGYYTWDLLNRFWTKQDLDPYMVDALLNSVTEAFAQSEQNRVKIPAEMEIPEGEAAAISEQVGTVTIPARLSLAAGDGDIPGKANGMWAVPYDGYLALLHKNERIMPAREYSSRTYSSNLYVENMNMSGGADAAGLASAIAAAQRRTMSGYGS